MIKLLNLVYIFYDTESFIIVVLTPTPILSFFKQGIVFLNGLMETCLFS